MNKANGRRILNNNMQDLNNQVLNNNRHYKIYCNTSNEFKSKKANQNSNMILSRNSSHATNSVDTKPLQSPFVSFSNPTCNLNSKSPTFDGSVAKSSPTRKNQSISQTHPQHKDIQPHYLISPHSGQISSLKELNHHKFIFEQKIFQLYDKLEQLDRLNLQSLPSSKIQQLIKNFKQKNPTGGFCAFVEELREKIVDLEKETEERFFIIQKWYECQRHEIEFQYTNEQSRTLQEYQEKRHELKESLKAENEEKRKQLEVDRIQLDINLDTTESKPATTRKLRRRGCNDNISNSPIIDTNSMSNAGSVIGIGNSSVSSSSILLSNGVVNNSLITSSSLINSSLSGINNLISNPNQVTSVSLHMSVNANLSALGTIPLLPTTSSSSSHLMTSSYFATINNNIINNMAASAVNDRKRKMSPSAIIYSLNEDDINEDFKYLQKNLSNFNYCGTIGSSKFIQNGHENENLDEKINSTS